MKRLAALMLGVIAIIASTARSSAEEMPDWQNPQVVQRNRVPMTTTFTTDGLNLSLSGTWKFNWNETVDTRPTDFYTVAYNDEEWGTIPVPGMWEHYGYGDPLYLNIGYPWKGHYKNNPPYPALEHNYVGLYRRTFTICHHW